MTEEILTLFVLFFDQNDMLYDATPPVNKPVEINYMIDRDLDVTRNGGVLRIIINTLIMLIDRR
jgi:hypothetical protein